MDSKISDEMKKRLWTESRYGCAVCGSPIFAGFHTLSYENDRRFVEDEMLPLCPTCLTNAQSGKFSRDYLVGYKKNPHNSRSGNDTFMLEGNTLVVNLGSTRFIDVNRILVINDFDLINVTKREKKSLILDVNFFDLANNFVGAIVNNDLVVDEKSKWCVDYKFHTLMIKNLQRNIFLNFSLISGELAITGRIYYMGHTIQLKQDGLFLDETDLTIGTKNVTISHVGAAFDVQI